MKANQPVVSTFSRPLNRNQANRTDPNLRQFPNNSYIPFDATFSPLPTRWNSKLWQSRNESLTRFEPWLSIVSHRPTIHYTSPLCLQLFENSSLHHETEHCLTTFPRWNTRETHKIISLDRSTRDERSDDDHFLTDSIINYVTFNHDIYRRI